MNDAMIRLLVAVRIGLLHLAERDRERGATAVEYGLMIALIAIVIIAAVTLLGGNLSGLFNKVATSVHS